MGEQNGRHTSIVSYQPCRASSPDMDYSEMSTPLQEALIVERNLSVLIVYISQRSVYRHKCVYTKYNKVLLGA